MPTIDEIQAANQQEIERFQEQVKDLTEQVHHRDVVIGAQKRELTRVRGILDDMAETIRNYSQEPEEPELRMVDNGAVDITNAEFIYGLMQESKNYHVNSNPPPTYCPGCGVTSGERHRDYCVRKEL